MNHRPPALRVVLLASAALAGVSAGAAPPVELPVELRFAARVGALPAHCGTTYEGIGLSRASLFLQDFRIYVSAIRLLASDGSEVPLVLTPDGVWQDDQVALLDFEDASGNCNGNSTSSLGRRSAVGPLGRVAWPAGPARSD